MAGYSRKFLINSGEKLYNALKEDAKSFESTCKELGLSENVGKTALGLYAKDNNLTWVTENK